MSKLDALEISKLYRLLKDFSNTPCTTKCVGKYDVCPMYKRGICELLYYVSKYINEEMTLEEFIDKMNTDFKNTKGFEE